MAQPEEKHVTPVSLVVDLVLVVAFFAFIFSILKSHVTSTDPRMINLWGALAAACMTGVFWLALQMFRVVLRAHRAAKK
jgi:phosphoglycerol transferase MdoB-like AlkP superfamily enzyme